MRFPFLFVGCLGILSAGPVRAESMVLVSSSVSDGTWTLPCEAMAWPSLDNHAFADHESLSYVVRWGAVSAGRGSIEVQGVQDFAQRSAYRLAMILETTGVTKTLHAYSEKTETWLDHATLLPLRYKKQTHEGRYSRNEDVTLEPACLRLNRLDNRLDKGTTEHKQVRLPGPTLDILGYIFYLRALPLKVGDAYNLTLVIGDHLYPITVAVKDRLKISTPAGWFDCFFIQPNLRDGLTTEKLHDLQLWLSADARKLPVRIRMGANFGHITADLITSPTTEP